MVPFRYSHVCIEAAAVNFPPNELTSAAIEDRLSALYKRLKIPFGTLEKLSGIKSRYLWDTKTMPSDMATEAARRALDKISFPKETLQAVFNCSVTRDFFEPATACLVHRKLGLPESAMAMDISNACIGFSNGIVLLGNLIESGVLKAGLIVSAETIAPILESTIQTLIQDTEITREQLLKILPTFTIGSGAVAYVLCHESISKSKHHIIGSVARSATQHCDLCSGNADYQVSDADKGLLPLMVTESTKLMASAQTLGNQMLKDFTSTFGWTRDSIDHVFCHQVGRQVNEAWYEGVGLDIKKEFTIYKKYGNLVSAALPSVFAVGMEEKGLKKGDKILLTAYGSGLNSIFTGVEW